MTARSPTPSAPSPGGRRPVLLFTLAGALQAFSAWPAYADDLLPGLLLSAAQLIPATEQGRTRCSVIMPTSYEGYSDVFEPPASSLKDDRDYDASVRGAYLGQTEVGKIPMPLPEALLEAGAAQRYRLRIPRRVQIPNPERGNGLPIWAWRVETRFMDVIVAGGPDAAVFPDVRSQFSQLPPALNAGVDDQGEQLGSAAVTPPGIWAGDRICLTGVPVRVLEYGDVEAQKNGLRFITAAILFRPQRPPGWLADPRVMRSLYHVLPLQEVRFVGFRNDGDGWRPTLVPDLHFIEKKTHLVEGD